MWGGGWGEPGNKAEVFLGYCRVGAVVCMSASSAVVVSVPTVVVSVPAVVVGVPGTVWVYQLW